MFVERMRALAVDPEAVEGGDAERRREVAVGAAAGARRLAQVETDAGRDVARPLEEAQAAVAALVGVIATIGSLSLTSSRTTEEPSAPVTPTDERIAV